MAKGENSRVALVVDDEPEHLQFLEEFLVSQGLGVRWSNSLVEGLHSLQDTEFRVIVVDMNVPDRGALTPAMKQRISLVERYPGLALVVEARNSGYGAHSVIVYTVHDDEAIDAELKRTGFRYVVKGRPGAMKQVIRSALAPTPSK